MSLRDFIRQNRAEIDAYIKGKSKSIQSLNDRDREEWIYNDASLYAWARVTLRRNF